MIPFAHSMAKRFDTLEECLPIIERLLPEWKGLDFTVQSEFID